MIFLFVSKIFAFFMVVSSSFATFATSVSEMAAAFNGDSSPTAGLETDFFCPSISRHFLYPISSVPSRQECVLMPHLLSTFATALRIYFLLGNLLTIDIAFLCLVV